MRLVIAAVGRLKEGPERQLFERYRDRVTASGRALGWGPLVLVEIPESRAPDPAARKADESARLVAKLRDAGARIVLDENGRDLTSDAFAAFLRGQREAGVRSLAFLIGGPDGHGPEALAGVDLTLSLGRMTLPHMLVRVVLAEQLYRAATILSGHPYHRS
ncbi:MAG: 23S rRNA (pseudouridine(1915)-N(3))-methyltransferase RlmH [Hyphomicrobiaceae bacterium]|nr:23S rRNA (pseudouridine(1915)-N(3))-methyltransferase RlmH [Hyphomicrobiaceae bacterium]